MVLAQVHIQGELEILGIRNSYPLLLLDQHQSLPQDQPQPPSCDIPWQCGCKSEGSILHGHKLSHTQSCNCQKIWRFFIECISNK